MCARGADRAVVAGPSTSPLGAMQARRQTRCILRSPNAAFRDKLGGAVVLACFCVLTGCVTEVPGVVYHVHLQETPTMSDCTDLGTGIAELLGASPPTPYIQEFRPWSTTKKTCSISINGNNPPKGCVVNVYVSNRDSVISLSITSERFGTPMTASSEEIARRVRAFMLARYPMATIEESKPVQGPFAP